MSESPGLGHVANRLLLVALIIAQFVVATLAALTTFLSGMSVARCGDPALECDFALLGSSQNVMYALLAATTLAVIAFTLLRQSQGRRTLWIPAAGILVCIVAYGIFSLVVDAATS
jgi:hypothetical protein